MRSIFILANLLLAFYSMHAQNQEKETETYYSFNSGGKMDINAAVPVGTRMVINGKLKTIRDKRFMLLLFQDISISNFATNNADLESEDSDTLLFDMDNKIVYNFKEEKSYRYNERKYELPKSGTDTISIIKGDTTILLLKTLDNSISPTATIAAMPYGIMGYSCKRFSFKYLSSSKTNFSLKLLYAKGANFKFSNEPFQFIY